MKKAVLNLYLWPALFLVTLAGLFLLPFALLGDRLCNGRNVRTSLRLFIRIYGWVLIRIVPFMAPVKVVGDIETIPSPAIFVANHASAIDPYLFGAIPVENCFVTSWPFKIPFYRQFMKAAGYVNSTNGWDTISRQCASLLKRGISITIWPEGHRSRNGKMGRFRRGAFQLAVETGCPIQPICILGSGEILPPGSRLINPGRVRMILLPAISPDTGDIPDREKANALRKNVVHSLRRCLQANTTQATEHEYQILAKPSYTETEKTQ